MSDPLVAHRAGGHRSADHSNTTDSSFSCYVEDHFRGAIEFLRSSYMASVFCGVFLWRLCSQPGSPGEDWLATFVSLPDEPRGA